MVEFISLMQAQDHRSCIIHVWHVWAGGRRLEKELGGSGWEGRSLEKALG